MEVFATPTFQAAHSVRGGSSFAILTASQQAVLYNAFDEFVTAFYNHPGSISNNDHTDDTEDSHIAKCCCMDGDGLKPHAINVSADLQFI